MLSLVTCGYGYRSVFIETVDFDSISVLSFEFERIWNSSNKDTLNACGRGWNHTFDWAILGTKNVNILRFPDGRYLPFPKLAIGFSFYLKQENLEIIRTGETSFYMKYLPSSISYELGELPHMKETFSWKWAHEHLWEENKKAGEGRIFKSVKPSGPSYKKSLIDNINVIYT